MTTERIDARDVLDANAKTTEAFSARVVGRFVRSGPDVWDDYVFEVCDATETVAVMADVPVQVEAEGARFRMRRQGEVLRLQWLPNPASGDADPPDRTQFLATCVRPWGDAPGRGAAAVIAEKLSSTAPKPSLD